MHGAFDRFRPQAWPYGFNGELHVQTIVGGTPSDPKVAEGWLRSKLASPDELLRQQVAEVMLERGIAKEEATEIVNLQKHLNGFKRDSENGLYIDGRQLKAAIKEAASIALAAGKIKGGNVWGKTNKGLLSFLAEHVCVVEDRLYLGTHEPSGIHQQFVHTFRGNGIKYEEYVTDAKIAFTVISDYPFTPKDWAMIWLTGEQQGLGASRSQGFGRYTVTRWEASGTS